MLHLCLHFFVALVWHYKLHLFLFSLTLSKSIVFWRFFAHRYWSKFATKLQQHCAPLLTTVLSLPWETKVRNISQFAHDSSNASFKSHDSYGETHHSKCSKCLPLALKHALKQSHHWSITLSMKLCWLLTIFQSDAISAHWRPSLITDKLVPAYRFQLASPGFRILCGFHAARGESEWCTLLWCLAAQTVAAIHLLSCWWLTFQCTMRAQEHRAAVTQDSGLHSHHTWDLQQTTPQSSRLQDMDSHSGIHLSETTRDVKLRWLSCGY